MSKQAEAKQAQGYSASGPTCSNCHHFTSEIVPINWMVHYNNECVAKGKDPYYDLTLPVSQKETNMRCAIGGFAIKKTAYRNRWEGKSV